VEKSDEAEDDDEEWRVVAGTNAETPASKSEATANVEKDFIMVLCICFTLEEKRCY